MNRFLPLILSCAGLSLACGPPTVGEATRGDAISALCPSAVLSFLADGWGVQIDGTLTKGAAVEVDYAPARLNVCAGTSGGRAVWGLTGYARIDGDPVQAFSISQPIGPDLISRPYSLQLPATGAELQLWFETSNVWGCHAYDSVFGQNYRFPIVGPTAPNDCGALH